MKKIVLTVLLPFLFTACETGIKPDSNSTKTAQNNGITALIAEESSLEEDEIDGDFSSIVLEKQNSSIVDARVQTFEGGVMSDGLNLKFMREGNHGDYLRLVFDTYAWLDGNSQPATSVGHYTANYNPASGVITVVIQGYRAFSAPFPDFASKSIVEKIYLGEYLDDSGYKFHIKLRDFVKIRVFNLKSPARLIIDIKKI